MAITLPISNNNNNNFYLLLSMDTLSSRRLSTMNLHQYIEPPFSFLVPSKEHSKNSSCALCDCALNLLTRHNCHFCGQSICAEHIAKKRADPKHPSKKANICASCEGRYLHYRACKRWQHQIDLQKEALLSAQNRKTQVYSQLSGLVQQLNRVNQEIQSNTYNYKDNKETNGDEIAKRLMEITQMKEQCQLIEQQTEHYYKQDEALDQQIEDNNRVIFEKQQCLKKTDHYLKKESDRLQSVLREIDNIQHMQQINHPMLRHSQLQLSTLFQSGIGGAPKGSVFSSAGVIQQNTLQQEPSREQLCNCILY